jgi:AAA domain
MQQLTEFTLINVRDLGYTPPASQASPHDTHTRQPVITTMDTVTATEVAWLWWPYIARGKLALIDGDPGLGKSLLTLQIAASLSRGWPLPNQHGLPTLATGSPQTTLLLSAEDSLSDTIKPRLQQSPCARRLARARGRSACVYAPVHACVGTGDRRGPPDIGRS